MCNQRPYDLVSLVIPLATGQVRPTILCITLHRTPLPTSSLCFVTTRRATPPQRLAPYPPVFKFNYLLKGFLNLLPLPSSERRQDRTKYRIVISDAASNPSLFVSVSSCLATSSYFTMTVSPSFGCGLRGTQTYHHRVFPRVIRSWYCILARMHVLRLGGQPRVLGPYTPIGPGQLTHSPD